MKLLYAVGLPKDFIGRRTIRPPPGVKIELPNNFFERLPRRFIQPCFAAFAWRLCSPNHELFAVLRPFLRGGFIKANIANPNLQQTILDVNVLNSLALVPAHPSQRFIYVDLFAARHAAYGVIYLAILDQFEGVDFH